MYTQEPGPLKNGLYFIIQYPLFMFRNLRWSSICSVSRFRLIRIFPVLLFLFITGNTRAQVKSYSFNSTTGVALETGSFTSLLGTFLDDDVSAMANIGFTFRYAGTDYTTFSVTSNGLMQLGGSAVTDYNNVTANLAGAYLMPYWDDNYTDANGYVKYKVTGTPGNRKLVVEYFLAYLGNTGAADKLFQVWLFETTNKVQFVYGAGNNFNGGYTVGLLSNGATDFVTVNIASHTSSVVTAQDNNVTWPGSGRSYSFTTGSTLPVTLQNFSGHRDGRNNQLQWTTVTEVNNRGFELQRSADGINFSTIGFIQSQAADGNSNNLIHYEYADNTLSGNKQYYRLYQLDTDGRGKYSSVIVIDGNKPTEVRLDAVFPNPVNTSTLNLQLTSPDRQSLAIRLYDMSGKIILQKSISVEAGSNTIPVDVSQLANSFYLVKITDDQGINRGILKLSVIK